MLALETTDTQEWNSSTSRENYSLQNIKHRREENLYCGIRALFVVAKWWRICEGTILRRDEFVYRYFLIKQEFNSYYSMHVFVKICLVFVGIEMKDSFLYQTATNLFVFFRNNIH